jgi:hypothetical protein
LTCLPDGHRQLTENEFAGTIRNQFGWRFRCTSSIGEKERLLEADTSRLSSNLPGLQFAPGGLTDRGYLNAKCYEAP